MGLSFPPSIGMNLCLWQEVTAYDFGGFVIQGDTAFQESCGHAVR